MDSHCRELISMVDCRFDWEFRLDQRGSSPPFTTDRTRGFVHWRSGSLSGIGTRGGSLTLLVVSFKVGLRPWSRRCTTLKLVVKRVGVSGEGLGRVFPSFKSWHAKTTRVVNQVSRTKWIRAPGKTLRQVNDLSLSLSKTGPLCGTPGRSNLH